MRTRTIGTLSLAAIVMLAVAPMTSAQVKDTGVVTKADLQQLAAKLKSGELKGSIMVFNSADRYALTTSYFAKKKQIPHLHAGHDEIMLIVSGSGKFTLGGELINGAPEDGYKWDEVMGTEIKGGAVYDVKEGDIISAPRGTPHMMDAGDGSVVYIVIKVPYILPYVKKMERGSK
jgi:quercetin dioxygenase-like cupin family protein